MHMPWSLSQWDTMIFRSMFTKRALTILTGTMLAAGVVMAQESNPAQSPAARPRPRPAKIEKYPAEQVQAGERLFVAQCGFCHGRDAAGGELGPDLTRSELVAQDSRGNKIGPMVRSGRSDAGMPAFPMVNSDVRAIAAFIHTQAGKFAELGGGRRTVEPADLATGNAADGRAYFNGAGRCAACHSATGDLAGIASRIQGLALLQRMLYPGGRQGPKPKATITLASGQTITGPVAADVEFNVTVQDAQGARQTYSKSDAKVKIDDPLAAHFEQLGKYTDADMHNLYAYLETLK
jgi:cytochrome c oxidase cbb3-type subunit 3